MKNIFALMIAAAMLSASVCAAPAENEEAVETFVNTSAEDEQEDIVYDEDIGHEEGSEAEDPIDDERYDEPADNAVYPTSDDIEKYFDENGWPENVSFICSTGAAMSAFDPATQDKPDDTVTYFWDLGVVGSDNGAVAQVQNMLDLMYSSYRHEITVVNCTLNHEERFDLMNQVTSYIQKAEPNIIVEESFLIKNAEEIQVIVSVAGADDADEQTVILNDLKKRVSSEYGDLVLIETEQYTADDVTIYGGVSETGVPETEIAEPDRGGGEYGVATNYDGTESADDKAEGAVTAITVPLTVGAAEAITAPEAPQNNIVLWVCVIGALAAVLAAAVIIYRKKHVPVYSTENGEITDPAPSAKKQVENAVKNSEITPDDDVFEKITRKIGK